MAEKHHEHGDSEKKMMEFRLLEGRLESLAKHRELVVNRMVEIESTIKSIEEVTKSDGDVIFHLGGEAFVSAKPNSNGKMVVMIGADVALEKTPAEAKETLESRKKEAEEAMKHVDDEMKSITKKLETMIPDIPVSDA